MWKEGLAAYVANKQEYQNQNPEKDIKSSIKDSGKNSKNRNNRTNKSSTNKHGKQEKTTAVTKATRPKKKRAATVGKTEYVTSSKTQKETATVALKTASIHNSV